VKPHVCTSCKRACMPCAEAAAAGQPLPHTVRLAWCIWCAGIYADNAPDPDTGRVHCQKCEAPFPDLIAFIKSGLAKYPRLCRKCRTDGRTAAAEDRAQDAKAGVEAVVQQRGPSSPAPDPLAKRKRGRPPLQPPPDDPTARERNYHCGGFVPRPKPDLHTSELAEEHTEWPGITHSSY